MVFPIGDDDSARRTVPVVTFALIALNVLVFFLEVSAGENFIQRWAFVPRRFSANPIAEASTVFSAMFMHGGWLHLFGNMLYLWILGDNVEDEFGPMQFLAFYLLCGIAATFSQFYFSVGSSIPNVGASGAIAGVLGAYIVMFPSAKGA
jgi:membrane associated rhomboid family serine protease